MSESFGVEPIDQALSFCRSLFLPKMSDMKVSDIKKKIKLTYFPKWYNYFNFENIKF